MAAEAWKVKQDMLPPGGYRSIDYKRRLPYRGLPDYGLLAIGIGAFVFETYIIYRWNWERRLLAFEDAEARISIMPLLMAEDDRKTLHLMRCNLDEEAKIMKNIPGWQVGQSVNHTTRWVSPRSDQLYFLPEVQQVIFFGYTWST